MVLSEPTYGAAARHMEALINRQDGTTGGASANRVGAQLELGTRLQLCRTAPLPAARTGTPAAAAD